MPREIPAIKRAFDVLELFLKEPRPMTVPEITARLNLPRTTAHEIVNTMVSTDYLRRDDVHTNKVFLGFKLFELGGIYAANFDLIAEGRRMAAELVDICDETVQMAVREGRETIFIAKVDCSKAVRLVSTVGSRLPAHCTAVGKMLLSSLTETEIIQLYGDQDLLQKMPANSITSISKLLQELETVRRRGMAYDDCESNVDIRCVAAPIYNHKNEMLAAMSISVPVTRMNMSKQDELASLICKGAEGLSRRLGRGL
ncbi:MAG: IclR family transcriptional regulator [Deltaproteobacteria bacterium]|nr:IclR family transcriptional regulator [Deltaproteobacteria bacterium]